MKTTTTIPTPETTTPPASALSSTLTSTSTFDIESYISRYDPKSNVTFQRLLFLCRTISDKGTSARGYHLLEERLKSKGNIQMYRDVFEHANDNTNAVSNTDASGAINMELDEPAAVTSGETAATNNKHNNNNNNNHNHHNPPSEIKYDIDYIQTTETNSTTHLHTLEANLNTAQLNLTKESTRNACLALAKFYQLRGLSEDAIRFYQRAREYSDGGSGSAGKGGASASGKGSGSGSGNKGHVGNSQLNDIILSLAECGLETRKYEYNKMIINLYEDFATPDTTTTTTATSDNTSISTTSTSTNTNTYNSKLKCSRGISYLNQGKYDLAAETFLSIKQINFTNQFHSVLSAEDIALYGGILGLVTLDRYQMDTMMEVEAWRERLELYPSLQEAIGCYRKAEYGKCLEYIHSLTNDMNHDMFLYPHVNTLWNMMREKCIIQYFQPYSSVSLLSMKDTFQFSTVDDVEDVVASLIESKRIVGAKIDGVNRTVTSMSVKGLKEKKRDRMMNKVGKMGDKLIYEVEGMILRMSCIENDIVVMDGSKGGGGGVRRGGLSHVGGGRSSGIMNSSDEELYDSL